MRKLGSEEKVEQESGIVSLREDEVQTRQTQVPTLQESSRVIAEQMAERRRQLNLEEIERRNRQTAKAQRVATNLVLEWHGKQHQVADFFGELAALSAAGYPIETALRNLSENVPLRLRSIAVAVAEQMELGVPMTQALSRWRKELPEMTLPILIAAERSSSLEMGLRQLAQAQRKLIEVERNFEYNPLLNGAVWPHLQKPLRGILPSRLGMATRFMASSQWQRVFAILWECGVPISVALEVCAGSARNPQYARALHLAAARTRMGWTLYDSLAETRILPPRLLDAIQTGETTGDLGPSLDQLARFQEDDSKMLAAQTVGLWLILFELILAAGAVMFLSPQAGFGVLLAGLVFTGLLFWMTAGEVRELRRGRKHTSGMRMKLTGAALPTPNAQRLTPNSERANQRKES